MDKENANLSLMYRKLKESFGDEESIKNINKKLVESSSSVTDKKLALSVDISTKNTWETNLTLYLDDVPFKYIGKGEQNAIKTKLAIQNNLSKTSIVMIEEPETSLSFGNMHKLLKNITENCSNKQIFVSTHSSFILNKIGVEKAIFIHNNNAMSMKDISPKTQDYFKKLPGYDTLRVVLSSKSILVEGPSDELIVQRAYLDTHSKLPIQDDIDVMSVSMGFKRFLEIAKKLQKNIVVVTDNDGDIPALQSKYSDYQSESNIKICYSKDQSLNTLETNIVAVNDLEVLNSILGQSYSDKKSLLTYMIKSKNKTKCALLIFESTHKITMPQYILDAIQ
jgi:predicted ATP-dependent endonuclease of OLD family